MELDNSFFYPKNTERTPNLLKSLYDNGNNYFTVLPRNQVGKQSVLLNEFGEFVKSENESDMIVGFGMASSLENSQSEDFAASLRYAVVDLKTQKEFLDSYSGYYKSTTTKLKAIEDLISQTGYFESFTSPGESLGYEEFNLVIYESLDDFLISALLIYNYSNKNDLDKGNFCYLHRNDGTGPEKYIRAFIPAKPRGDVHSLASRGLGQFKLY